MPIFFLFSVMRKIKFMRISLFHFIGTFAILMIFQSCSSSRLKFIRTGYEKKELTQNVQIPATEKTNFDSSFNKELYPETEYSDQKDVKIEITQDSNFPETSIGNNEFSDELSVQITNIEKKERQVKNQSSSDFKNHKKKNSAPSVPMERRNKGILLIIVALVFALLGFVFFTQVGVLGGVFAVIFWIAACVYFLWGLLMVIRG